MIQKLSRIFLFIAHLLGLPFGRSEEEKKDMAELDSLFDNATMTLLQKGRFGKIHCAGVPLCYQEQPFAMILHMKSGWFCQKCPTFEGSIPFLQRSQLSNGGKRYCAMLNPCSRKNRGKIDMELAGISKQKRRKTQEIRAKMGLTKFEVPG